MAVEALNAPSAGALSIDQAAGLLGDAIEREDDAPAPELEAQPEHEPEAEPTAEGGEEPEGASPAEAEEEPPEPEEPAIEPPLFWAAEDKEAFKDLPRHLQQKLVEKEEQASKAVAKAMQQAAETRKAADQEAQKLAQHAQRIDGLLSQTEAALEADGWAEWLKIPDAQWINLLRQDPDQVRPIKEQVDLRKAQLQQLMSAKQEADGARQAQAFNAYLAAQTEELARIAPHLAADKAKRVEIGQYLLDQGVPADRLRGVGAQDLVIAEKAMRWDQAQKAQKNVKPQPKPAPAPSKPVKPAASAATPPKQRATQAVAQQFGKSRSIDDAVALLNAKGYG